MRVVDRAKRMVQLTRSDGVAACGHHVGRSMQLRLSRMSRSLGALSKECIIVTWADFPENKNNFGDVFNIALIEEISGKTVVNASEVYNVGRRPVFSVIGSILDNMNIANLEVWGSGFMHSTGRFLRPPKRIHAVRGPLSRELILKQGIECPEVYGDPALLAPILYSPPNETRYALGIIPHIVDKDNSFIEQIHAAHPEDVLIVDIQQDFQELVTALLSCEHIASSSLHGLILADAYHIPSLWIELSHEVLGDGFKFRDYMASVDRTQQHPYTVSPDSRLREILAQYDYVEASINLEALIQACPFQSFSDTQSRSS